MTAPRNTEPTVIEALRQAWQPVCEAMEASSRCTSAHCKLNGCMGENMCPNGRWDATVRRTNAALDAVAARMAELERDNEVLLLRTGKAEQERNAFAAARDMDAGCLDMVREQLVALLGEDEMKHTPAMMYPEAIRHAIGVGVRRATATLTQERDDERQAYERAARHAVELSKRLDVLTETEATLRRELAKRPTQEEALTFIEDEILDGTATFQCDYPRLLIDAIYDRKAQEAEQ